MVHEACHARPERNEEAENAACTVRVFARFDGGLETAECALALATPAFCGSASDFETYELRSRTFSCILCASSGLDLCLPLPATSCPSTRWPVAAALSS